MDNFLLGLQVAGIGIGGVFCVLLFLMCVFMGVGKLMTQIKNKEKAAPAPVKAPAPAAAPAVASEDDSEVVAAISAAIMAILSSENNGILPTFEIKKIKQIKRN